MSKLSRLACVLLAAVAFLGMLLALFSVLKFVSRRIGMRKMRRQGRFLPWGQVLEMLDEGIIVINKSSDRWWLRVWFIPQKVMDRSPRLPTWPLHYCTNCPLWFPTKRRIKKLLPQARIEEYDPDSWL